MDPITLTTEMIAVLCLLGFTVFLFVSELLRVDLAAILVMVVLGMLSYFPGLEGLADVRHLFDGFASNAVISIIAVMIIGAGLDKTGLMSKVAAAILRFGGSTERRVVPVICGTVGFISSFLQNVGAAALFLPVVSRISARTDIPLSRMLMPMGFCAILGGTMTLVGSSPLILLNDLIVTANTDLPEGQKMQAFSLFSVTPVGAALLVSGIAYFMIFGKWVLPAVHHRDGSSGQSMHEYLKRLYGLDADIFEVSVPAGNLLLGEKIGEIMEAQHLYVIGYYASGNRIIAPKLTQTIGNDCRLAILGKKADVQEMALDYGLMLHDDLNIFTEEFVPTRAGVAEIVIPPDSNFIGKTAREIDFRQSLGLSLLAIYRGGETFSYVETEDHEGTRIGVIPFQVGDTLVVHAQWDRLVQMKKNRAVVVVTSDFPQEELRPQKVGWALVHRVPAGQPDPAGARRAVQRHRRMDRATDTDIAGRMADLVPAGRYRPAFDGFHAGDVQCRRDGPAGAAGCVDRGRGGWRSRDFRPDRGDLDLELLPDPDASGQCADHGPGGLSRHRFRPHRRHHDSAFPGRFYNDDESGILTVHDIAVAGPDPPISSTLKRNERKGKFCELTFAPGG